MRFIPAMAALLAAAVPAAAPAAPHPHPGAVQINDEMAAYGRWLAAVQAAELPLRAHMTQLQSRWATAANDPGFRPFLAGLLAEVDRTDAALDAVQQPDISAIDLPDELGTAAILVNIHVANRHVRDMLANFGSLLDSIERNDPDAEMAALHDVLETAGLLADGQVLFARAQVAALPPDSAAVGATRVELFYFQATARIIHAMPAVVQSIPDAALPGDLDRLAGDLETLVRDGAARMDAEIAGYRAIADRAEQSHRTAEAATLRRAAAVLVAGRQSVPVAQQLSATLRGAAADFRATAPTPQTLATLIQRFQPVRAALEQIVRDEAAIMSGTTAG